MIFVEITNKIKASNENFTKFRYNRMQLYTNFNMLNAVLIDIVF